MAAYGLLTSSQEFAAAGGLMMVAIALAAATGFALIVQLDGVARTKDIEKLIAAHRQSTADLLSAQRDSTVALIAALQGRSSSIATTKPLTADSVATPAGVVVAMPTGGPESVTAIGPAAGAS